MAKNTVTPFFPDTVYITAMTDVQLKYLAYFLVWNMCYYPQLL